VNREELNWLLETIQDAQDRGAFRVGSVRARQNFLSGDGDVARERGWINHTANQFLAMATRHSTEYATTELPIAIVR